MEPTSRKAYQRRGKLLDARENRLQRNEQRKSINWNKNLFLFD